MAVLLFIIKFIDFLIILDLTSPNTFEYHPADPQGAASYTSKVSILWSQRRSNYVTAD
jgi:hypothetical protein